MLWPQPTPDGKMATAAATSTAMPSSASYAPPRRERRRHGQAPLPTIRYEDDMAIGGANPNTDPNEHQPRRGAR